MNQRTDRPLPTISATVAAWFLWYVKKYQVGKFFHATRLLKQAHPASVPLDQPLIIYLNHPSWWDPLLCIVASELFPHRAHYAPMDAEMLKKYGIFRQVGFFGIEPTAKGAIQFLRMSERILATPSAMLWLTAQGEFRDVRVRPPQLKSGLGALLHRLERGFVLPLAIEYPFWNEKKPEAMLAFGKPIDVAEHEDWNSEQWTQRLDEAMAQTQNELAEAVISRDPVRFEVILSGKSGVGGVYDLYRRLKARVRGKQFTAEHQ